MPNIAAELFFNYFEQQFAPVFLGGLADEDWEFLLEHTELRRLRAGETLIRAGEADRSLYLLTQGTLTVTARHLTGRTIDAPSIVGEVAFFDGGRRSTTLVAATDVEIRRLTIEQFEVLSARQPHLGRVLLLELGKIIAKRLRLATSLLNEDV
jgi:SulP family sulfate permease